jgi:hypothetical protein
MDLMRVFVEAVDESGSADRERFEGAVRVLIEAMRVLVKAVKVFA